jgi:hypothetical protein
MNTNLCEVGDTIKFRVGTLYYCGTATRKVREVSADWPLVRVRFAGWPEFEVYTNEILTVNGKAVNQ